jgi:hypothetical protein
MSPNNFKQRSLNISALIPRQEENKGGNKAAENFSFYVKLAINSVALAAQITGFVVWPLLEIQEKPQLWVLPIATIFISCGWWENYYVSAKNSGKHHTINHLHSGLPRFEPRPTRFSQITYKCID